MRYPKHIVMQERPRCEEPLSLPWWITLAVMAAVLVFWVVRG